jgi:hypothetical protein
MICLVMLMPRSITNSSRACKASESVRAAAGVPLSVAAMAADPQPATICVIYAQNAYLVTGVA